VDDASRVTWARVFLTLGGTMGLGTIVRWVRWNDDGGYGSAPQVLWTMGFLALGFLLVSVQLGLRGWLDVWADAFADANPRDDERQKGERGDAVDR
jgi:hypothetical protein